ncbi:hypothetical protein QVD99_007977 [Batrachochytrium dendrobatidis]|nr:hypothetical protein O5D80_004869 [Batrachochytrium dendrobatidis]KAK5665125.1 hypothetical protein QVD99_007977 [Batrachochytrium dendrobatidis]
MQVYIVFTLFLLAYRSQRLFHQRSSSAARLSATVVSYYQPDTCINFSYLPFTMQAVVVTKPGDAAFLKIQQVPAVVPQPSQLLVQVRSFALNRMDISQRNGLYPPPPGASDILGVEFAGVVIQTTLEPTTKFKVGDKVFGLVSGGAYAEQVVAEPSLTMHIPDGMSFEEAAAIPETWLTATQALFFVNRLQPGENVMIHAGASGVGTAAIQLAKQANAQHIITTAGSDAKTQFCKSLGSTVSINYKTANFADVVKETTNGRGVDVIVDFVGGPYFSKNLDSLAMDGRMVILSFLGGAVMDEKVHLGPILRKRLQINGSTLRSRTVAYQTILCDYFVEKSLPLFTNGTFKPIIDRVFEWTDIIEAHKHMEANASIGKIVMRIA